MTDIFENNKELDNENFEELLENSIKGRDDFSIGDKVNGTVVFITNDNAFIDISGKSEAIIDIGEFRDENDNIGIDTGDSVEAYVVSTRGGEIHLTTNIGKGIITPELIEMAYNNSVPIHGVIIDTVKGGYLISISGIKCFCPFSQIDIRPPDSNNNFINKSFLFKIIELTERGKNIILSRRALLEEQRELQEENLKKTLNVGDKIKGTISAARNFGLFIDIGGFEALIPKSELSWSRYVDTENFKFGQEITALVKSIDWGNKRITLSVKELSQEPWETIGKYSLGQTLNGRIVNIIKNGAFVEIEPGLDGFIHISKMSHLKKINKPEEIVSIGDTVNVTIINIIPEERRLSLELLTDGPDPWQESLEELLDTTHSGIIEASRSSGLNVRLSNGMLGFIPRGELKFDQISDIQKKYPVGGEIKTVIININKDDRKLILSEKGGLKKEEQEDYENFRRKDSSSETSTLGSLFKNQFDNIQKKINK